MIIGIFGVSLTKRRFADISRAKKIERVLVHSCIVLYKLGHKQPTLIFRCNICLFVYVVASHFSST